MPMESILERLPEFLRERTRTLKVHDLPASGKYVLYWMRTAVRVVENPALDVAIHIANEFDLPVLIYHGLSERYPYASDRHHTFILQGARDVQAAFKSLNVEYAFHLERAGHRQPHLKNLASLARFVVTEDMPVSPLRNWTMALSKVVTTPILLVDTACVVPMQLLGRAFDRAFEFRDATSKLFAERLNRRSESAKSHSSDKVLDNIPFEPIDLQHADIAELISTCDIDHSIGPVPQTVGGSVAGYQRWQAFQRHGLGKYARLRNGALLDGVSRMSPYLHYGMVSPMRIAREAASIQNPGAEKFLDELLIWRELSYAFCFYRPDHERLSALPDWAIATLTQHQDDQRPALLSMETLARGRTGDLLWDAAQRSLLMHGELHNNVRMTWGKSLLEWTSNAKSALATMIDLNHRYALDGRDPASYGGILWCLGQFDRPFLPERPIFGRVRDRSTLEHSRRLDPQAFMKKATRPICNPMPTVAVIGAGISGLVCARTLVDHGLPVKLFEKSRGVAGRMATRRTESGISFDHGAQYFTVQNSCFKRYVDSWVHDGIVKSWNGRIVTLVDGSTHAEKSSTQRFVASPGMNSIGKYLATDLDIYLQTTVAPLKLDDNKWQLLSDDGRKLGEFDVVVVAAPAPQAAAIMQAVPQLATRAEKASMRGCWCVMLSMTLPLDVDFDAAFISKSPLAWIARDSSKPDRGQQCETWVLHASAEWSECHIEASKDDVERQLIQAFWKATGHVPTPLLFSTTHRWRYATPVQPLEENCLFDRTIQIGACGDWCAGSRVEGAFLSGIALAGRILGNLKHDHMPIPSTTLNQLELF